MFFLLQQKYFYTAYKVNAKYDKQKILYCFNTIFCSWSFKNIVYKNKNYFIVLLKLLGLVFDNQDIQTMRGCLETIHPKQIDSIN